MRHWISMIEGCSIFLATVAKVVDVAKKYERILICLDLNHTHDHVLAELDVYAPLVSKGSYLNPWRSRPEVRITH